MTDLNAPYDATERDALAWRMLEERLDMIGVDLEALHLAKHDESMHRLDRNVFAAPHDALAYRRQT